MCVFTGCSHTCVKCVFFFFLPGPDFMCMFSCNSEVHVCTQSPHTFFSVDMAPLLSAPQCPGPVTDSLKGFLFFSFLNSVHQFTGSCFDSSFHSFVYSEFITQIFFPPSFLPDSQAAAVPNSLALHFFKATFKKQVDHTPPTYEIMLGK